MVVPKFRLGDLPLLLKKDKRYQIAFAVIILIILVPFFSKPKETKRSPIVFSVSDRDRFAPPDQPAQDLIEVFQAGLNQIGRDQKALNEKVEKTEEKLITMEERTALILKRMIERFYELEREKPTRELGLEPQDIIDSREALQGLDHANLETWGYTDDEPEIEGVRVKERVAIISTGDRVSVKLLTGIDASTDDKPYPVLFQVTGDVIGPNYSILPIGDALITAVAQGSLSNFRVIFRLLELSIGLPSGQRKIIPIDGWIVGEDGMTGLKGKLIDPIGTAIQAGTTIGALNGLGEGLAEGTTSRTNIFGTQTESVTGDITTHAIGKALQGGTQVISETIKERLEKLEPTIEIFGGRECTAIFVKSTTIPDLYESIANTYSDNSFMNMD